MNIAKLRLENNLPDSVFFVNLAHKLGAEDIGKLQSFWTSSSEVTHLLEKFESLYGYGTELEKTNRMYFLLKTLESHIGKHRTLDRLISEFHKKFQTSSVDPFSFIKVIVFYATIDTGLHSLIKSNVPSEKKVKVACQISHFLNIGIMGSLSKDPLKELEALFSYEKDVHSLAQISLLPEDIHSSLMSSILLGQKKASLKEGKVNMIRINDEIQAPVLETIQAILESEGCPKDYVWESLTSTEFFYALGNGVNTFKSCLNRQ